MCQNWQKGKHKLKGYNGVSHTFPSRCTPKLAKKGKHKIKGYNIVSRTFPRRYHIHFPGDAHRIRRRRPGYTAVSKLGWCQTWKLPWTRDAGASSRIRQLQILPTEQQLFSIKLNIHSNLFYSINGNLEENPFVGNNSFSARFGSGQSPFF